MKNGGGIIVLSLPFTAGVAAGTLFPEPFLCALASSLACSVLLWTACASRRRSEGTLMLLYFMAGCLCGSRAVLCPDGHPETLEFTTLLGERIDALGLPGEHSAAIVKALITGRRNALGSRTIEVFRKSGASHILALSGLHLGVIYAFLRKLLMPLGNSRSARLLRAAAIIALCGYYALATGASASITRAFLFIFLHECAALSPGRRHSILGTFCTALTIQLAVTPGVILSAGFQLSYLAMLGIILLAPRLQAWYPDSGRPDPLRWIWKSAAMSLSCQLFTAPVAWLRFRSLPLYFLLSNLIALPLTEVIIVGSVSALLLDAAGACPRLLVSACGRMAGALEYCLEIIASL